MTDQFTRQIPPGNGVVNSEAFEPRLFTPLLHEIATRIWLVAIAFNFIVWSGFIFLIVYLLLA